MALEDALHALAESLPWVAAIIGAGYAIGQAYRYHWKGDYLKKVADVRMMRERHAVIKDLLKKGKYDCNTLIISLKECAKIYQLEIIEDNLPTNKGYITTFYLVKKSSASNKH